MSSPCLLRADSAGGSTTSVEQAGALSIRLGSALGSGLGAYSSQMASDRPESVVRQAPPLKAVPSAEAVVAQYSSYVASIGYRILGSRAELDDLLQDVFLEVHRNLKTLREPEAVRGWLATITVRVARRMVRTRRLTAFLLPFDAFRPVDAVDIGASAEERHLYSRVYAILDRMPANSRVAWVMKVLEGEPLQRVADLCGCSLAAVKRRIAKVDEAMTEELGHA